jgi:hypothetical protein
MQTARTVFATLVGVAVAIFLGWLGWGTRGAMDRAYGATPRTVVTETTTVRTQSVEPRSAPAVSAPTASPQSDIARELASLGQKIDSNFQRLEQGQNALSSRVTALEEQRNAPQPQPTPPCNGSSVPASSPEGEWSPARVPPINR